MYNHKGLGTVGFLIIILLVLISASVFFYFKNTMFHATHNSDYDAEFLLVKKAVQLYPYDPLAWFSAGRAHYFRGEFEAAAEHFQEAVTLNDRNQEAVFFLGITYLELERLPEAEHYLKLVLERAEFPDRVLFALGDLEMKKKKYDKAIEYYQHALARMPNTVDLWAALAAAYEAKGLYKEAVNALEKAKLFSPAQEPDFSKQIEQ